MTPRVPRPADVRDIARHVALDILATGLRLRTGRGALSRPRVHFLYLHSVPPAELGRFRGLLSRLVEHHDLVSYSEAVRLVRGPGHLARPAICFSFDDGFLSNVAAASELENFGTTACFFVPTGFVGCRSISEARQFFRTEMGVDESAMSWSDLEMLVKRGHEIGSHTVSHRVLAELSSQEVAEEIGSAREHLRRRLGQGDHFAWPRGRFAHFSPEAAHRVREAGHLSCASAERGSHRVLTVSREDLCIRRDHVMTSWPLRHIEYFLAKSAMRAGQASWPEGWSR